MIRQLLLLARDIARHTAGAQRRRADAAEARLARTEADLRKNRQRLKEYTDANAQLARTVTDLREVIRLNAARMQQLEDCMSAWIDYPLEVADLHAVDAPDEIKWGQS